MYQDLRSFKWDGYRAVTVIWTTVVPSDKLCSGLHGRWDV